MHILYLSLDIDSDEDAYFGTVKEEGKRERGRGVSTKENANGKLCEIPSEDLQTGQPGDAMVIALTTAMSTPAALLQSGAIVGSFTTSASCRYAVRMGQKDLFSLKNRTALIGSQRWSSSSRVVSPGARSSEGSHVRMGSQGMLPGSVRNRGLIGW